MGDTKATMTRNSHQDGVLHIPRLRSGAYQPKDSLGLSCILPVNKQDCVDQHTNRRRTLTAPRDNIGISCLPTKDLNYLRDASEITETNIRSVIHSHRDKTEKKGHVSHSHESGDPVLMLSSVMENLKCDRTKTINKPNVSCNIGISNIQRPRSDSIKTRRPIFPRDNIGVCCRLLQKPTVSCINFGALEKKVHKATKYNEGTTKKTQSVTNLKNKQTKKALSKRPPQTATEVMELNLMHTEKEKGERS